MTFRRCVRLPVIRLFHFWKIDAEEVHGCIAKARTRVRQNGFIRIWCDCRKSHDSTWWDLWEKWSVLPLRTRNVDKGISMIFKWIEWMGWSIRDRTSLRQNIGVCAYFTYFKHFYGVRLSETSTLCVLHTSRPRIIVNSRRNYRAEQYSIFGIPSISHSHSVIQVTQLKRMWTKNCYLVRETEYTNWFSIFSQQSIYGVNHASFNLECTYAIYVEMYNI